MDKMTTDTWYIMVMHMLITLYHLVLPWYSLQLPKLIRILPSAQGVGVAVHLIGTKLPSFNEHQYLQL